LKKFAYVLLVAADPVEALGQHDVEALVEPAALQQSGSPGGRCAAGHRGVRLDGDDLPPLALGEGLRQIAIWSRIDKGFCISVE
jgi:hypothetical protein